ncbi:hypothetical protein ACFL20_08845 [Spirochaetota bacterium]
MKIKDIIKSDKDRLFIVDPECFIVFTGDSLDDEKPFIRIGNWIDLPAEIIPLIENIIITDNIAGNPAFEQFNIDIEQDRSNKYIGIEHIVKEFLDFQKLFFLDIQSASIVNIEKDIPELPEKTTSNNQYIGVFYRDSNFRILHNNREIFNLREVEKEYLDYNGIHDIISEKYRLSNSYNGDGLVILDKSPMFYSNNTFLSYFLPGKYFDEFSKLNIDPLNITHVLFPSNNFTNLIKFLNWKRENRGEVNIYSDYHDELILIKKFFSHNRINISSFSSLNKSISQNLTVTNYRDTLNIKLTYNSISPDNEKLSIAYIRDSRDIEKIIKENPHAFFIEYSVYEKTNLLFKSSPSPIVIIDDGNKNISKVTALDTIVLNPGQQYSIKKYKDIHQIYNDIKIDDEIIEMLNSNQLDQLKLITDGTGKSLKGNLHEHVKLFNILSLIRLSLFNTRSRPVLRELRNLYGELHQKIDYTVLRNNSWDLKIELQFFSDSIFQFIIPEARNNDLAFKDEILINENPHPQEAGAASEIGNSLTDRDQYRRILKDRVRLIQLLDLYIKKLDLQWANNRIKNLSRKINQRINIFMNNNFDPETFQHEINKIVPKLQKAENKQTALKETLKVPARKETEDISTVQKNKYEEKVSPEDKENDDVKTRIETNDKSIENDDVPETMPGRLKNKLIAAVSLGVIASVILIIIFFSGDDSSISKTGDDKFIEENLKSTEEIVKEERELEKSYSKLRKKHNFSINDTDIHNYANKIALKNGYNKITITNAKNKNPHWIYPLNVFTLHDGEKAIVNKRDTLWKISRKKLIKMGIKFYEKAEEVKKADINKRVPLIDEMKINAFKKDHTEMILKLQRELTDGSN